jgi:hypothetical protein
MNWSPHQKCEKFLTLPHSVVINIRGNSFRLRGKVKAKEVNELQKVN